MKIKKIIATVTALVLVGGAYHSAENTEKFMKVCADEVTKKDVSLQDESDTETVEFCTGFVHLLR